MRKEYSNEWLVMARQQGPGCIEREFLNVLGNMVGPGRYRHVRLAPNHWLEVIQVKHKWEGIKNYKEYPGEVSNAVQKDMSGQKKSRKFRLLLRRSKRCSAEGHVSHILLTRLSRRPDGWSKTGADQMARLRDMEGQLNKHKRNIPSPKRPWRRNSY
ncbi:hypothetical protein GFC01_13865 [Desulfofundulus thermobenzoicus]|uniref:Uncharacterized protein n=1 Tax=Desulfofundulus thermobenzoicus TaxID=29376 RepID=A0A6N7IUV1_9FIRM|nr:hypothetical protein [Desulfofundulus thermobenzoicus]